MAESILASSSANGTPCANRMPITWPSAGASGAANPKVDADSEPIARREPEEAVSLARTSAGVGFEDRAEQELKGVGEAVRVWAVSQRTENARLPDGQG